MSSTRDRVPPHLRRYVVEQDYDQYTAVDQAVWRFVLLQMVDKLSRTAHGAYRKGLAETGISAERIPSLNDMDACLGRYGWGAVGVDGFIPPRAFTEFQSLGLLPICAEIRTAQHLVYTPAPDIIHEAAGHAPILVDTKYAEYLKRIGEVGAQAFHVPEDSATYDAIYTLSEVKERPDATPSEVAAAEQTLEQLLLRKPRVSEATRVSRLYWWTAEYGLIGKPSDYKLYGAGLLSSLGESHSCHDPKVKKLPLTAACAEVDYDITKTQPQLFVVESFDQLSAVLDEVAESLAFCSGGLRGLNEAESSEELCTLTLDTGLQLIGQVSQVVAPQDAGAVLARVRGRTAFARAGSLVTRAAPAALPAELWLLVGRHADGAPLVGLSSAGNARTVPGNSCQLKLGGGLVLTAELLGEDALGSQSLFRCQEARLLWHGQLLASSPQVLLLLASEVTGARAGAVDPNYYDETEFSVLRAPKPRVFPPQERDMLVLYERALAAHHGSTEEMLSTFQELHERLMVQSPRDWLLRWNMLESLLKRKVEGPLSQALAQELTALERYYDAQEPIASGLGYLGFS